MSAPPEPAAVTTTESPSGTKMSRRRPWRPRPIQWVSPRGRGRVEPLSSPPDVGPAPAKGRRGRQRPGGARRDAGPSSAWRSEFAHATELGIGASPRLEFGDEGNRDPGAGATIPAAETIDARTAPPSGGRDVGHPTRRDLRSTDRAVPIRRRRRSPPHAGTTTTTVEPSPSLASSPASKRSRGSFPPLSSETISP